MRRTVLPVLVLGALCASPPPGTAAERPILDGRWDTEFTTPQSESVEGRGDNTRRWVFRRHMKAKRCKLKLSYELTLGGFDSVCLRRQGSKYVGTDTARTVPCGRGYERGRTTERFSVRVLGSELVDGRRYATRIESYYRATYRATPSSRCKAFGRELRHYLGDRLDVPGE